MSRIREFLKRTVIVAYLFAVHLLLVYFLIDKYISRTAQLENFEPAELGVADVRATPLPTPEPEKTPLPVIATPFPTISDAVETKVIIPVQGVTRDQLIDTFFQARSEGRNHDAIDIPAPLGTPVMAATDGEVVKFHDSEKGGITIYQITADRKYFFYYAHLQRRDERIAEKQFVKKGTVIGYVGDTGNSGAGNYHLHFAITVASDPNRFWEGLSINPYQILRGDAVLQ